MTHARYLELLRAEIDQLESALTAVNLAAQTPYAMFARGNLRHRIDQRRLCIALIERTMAAA
jgi:hypothetical protein